MQRNWEPCAASEGDTGQSPATVGHRCRRRPNHPTRNGRSLASCHKNPPIVRDVWAGSEVAHSWSPHVRVHSVGEAHSRTVAADRPSAGLAAAVSAVSHHLAMAGRVGSRGPFIVLKYLSIASQSSTSGVRHRRCCGHAHVPAEFLLACSWALRSQALPRRPNLSLKTDAFGAA